MTLLLAYATMDGTSTVLNKSIQKLMSCDLHLPIKGMLIMVYAVLAVMGLASGALANGNRKDASLFVPISSCVNLVMNCLAGQFVWEDAASLQNPCGYILVYVLVVRGTFLVSSVNVFSVIRLRMQDRFADVKGVASSIHGPMAVAGNVYVTVH